MTNFSDMLSKAKDMQEKMKKAQDQIKKIQVEGEAGGERALEDDEGDAEPQAARGEGRELVGVGGIRGDEGLLTSDG